MLKVALINNMNNNFFALMRFLRDRGVDAHLFQIDELDGHFLPECDSFDSTQYLPYVHTIANISFRDFFKLPFSYQLRKRLKTFKDRLVNFDIVIGCGGLAILEWAGIKIDIFIPYGGDLYQSPFMFEYSIKKHFPYSFLMRRYIKLQRQAIAKTRSIIAFASVDRHLYNALIQLEEAWIDWPIPMVYPLPDVNTGKWTFLKEHDFILFSHTRHGWKTALDYKGNDKAIRAFAKFIKEQKVFKKPVMVLFEYGPDFTASKKLIQSLGIAAHVYWMPTMQRKYIYEGLKYASLVFDYFHDEVVSFGGVTFESFCCSKPVIGNSVLKDVSAPHSVPLIHAYTEEDILNVLFDYTKQPEKYQAQGFLSRFWFDQNVGKGLVDKYIALIEYLAAYPSVSLRSPTFDLPLTRPYIGPDHIQ